MLSAGAPSVLSFRNGVMDVHVPGCDRAFSGLLDSGGGAMLPC